jgi:di/tricarboxylate transporter
VFSANIIRIPQMARAGFWINLCGAIVITLTLHLTLKSGLIG